MADIIGSYERLPNDAVRAVAVAKRREYYIYICLTLLSGLTNIVIGSTSTNARRSWEGSAAIGGGHLHPQRHHRRRTRQTAARAPTWKWPEWPAEQQVER